jgi:hypothetical protein
LRDFPRHSTFVHCAEVSKSGSIFISAKHVRQLFFPRKGLNLKVMGEELSLGRSVGSGAYGKENGRV